MTKPETALSAVVERTFPLSEFGDDLHDYLQRGLRDVLYADLTALISEHYYPKEFISWFRSEEFFDDFDEHIEDGNTYWVRVGFSLIYESIDELYQYYKENEQ